VLELSFGAHQGAPDRVPSAVAPGYSVRGKREAGRCRRATLLSRVKQAEAIPDERRLAGGLTPIDGRAESEPRPRTRSFSLESTGAPDVGHSKGG
jgi:hypothetical protein